MSETARNVGIFLAFCFVLALILLSAEPQSKSPVFFWLVLAGVFGSLLYLDSGEVLRATELKETSIAFFAASWRLMRSLGVSAFVLACFGLVATVAASIIVLVLTLDLGGGGCVPYAGRHC